MNQGFATPDDIARKGREIYDKVHKASLEAEHTGKYVAVSVYTERAYVEDDANRALVLAFQKEPEGLFHLIKIGSDAAFKLGYLSSGQSHNWLF